MSTHSYNPRNVVISAGGVPITGLVKETFVEVSYEEDQVTMRNTLQGDTIFSVNRANGSRVTLTVDRNSNANALLSSYYKAQRTTGGGAFPFAIVDNNVPDAIAFFACPQARVARMPNESFGADAPTITWEILCGEAEHFIGSLPSSALEAI